MSCFLVIARSVCDEAIQPWTQAWIASRSLSSGARSRDPVARNNVFNTSFHDLHYRSGSDEPDFAQRGVPDAMPI
jgi:hypothetical protein